MQLVISSHPRVPAWVWISVFRHYFFYWTKTLLQLSPRLCSQRESLIQFTNLHFSTRTPTSLLQHFILQKALFVISVSFYFCRAWASLTSRVQAWTVAEDASATQRKAVGWVSVSCLPDLGSYTSTESTAHHSIWISPVWWMGKFISLKIACISTSVRNWTHTSRCETMTSGLLFKSDFFILSSSETN